MTPSKTPLLDAYIAHSEAQYQREWRSIHWRLISGLWPFLVIVLLIAADVASGQETDEAPRWRPTTRGEVRSLLIERAEYHGANPAVVVAVADCESSLRPWVTGDHGSSHGLAQLSDLPGTGLLWHFHAQGFTNAYDAEQAAEYLALVAAGRFSHEGVTLRRWSCHG